MGYTSTKTVGILVFKCEIVGYLATWFITSSLLGGKATWGANYFD